MPEEISTTDYNLPVDNNGFAVQTFTPHNSAEVLAGNGIYYNDTVNFIMLRCVATTDTFFKCEYGNGTGLTVASSGANVGHKIVADDKEYIPLPPHWAMKIDSAGGMIVGKVI